MPEGCVKSACLRSGTRLLMPNGTFSTEASWSRNPWSDVITKRVTPAWCKSEIAELKSESVWSNVPR